MARLAPALPRLNPARLPGLAALAGREREVRETFWLLLAALWVLLPHLPELPRWTAVTAVLLLAWRGFITWTGRRLPNSWLLIGLMLAAGLAVWWQFRTIFGKDAGVAYIVMLLGLKLLEMRAHRDVFVVDFLCLFVLLTSFFESQSIATAGHMLVALWLLVTAMVSASFGAREPPWTTRLKIAGQLCLLAVPLMVVLFLFFPRVQGPLWGMPADAFTGRPGLSDSMSPGTIASLGESNEIAFRVQFKGSAPPQAERYWRGPVLSTFTGRNWRPGPQRFVALLRAPGTDAEADSRIEYTVTLEPHNQPWLLVLDAAAAAPRIEGTPTSLRPSLEVVAQNLVRERLRYDAVSHTRFHYGRDDLPQVLRDNLLLPADYNPRTLQYARNLRERVLAESGADSGLEQRLSAAVLAWFRQEQFFYTLQPPLLGRDSVDEFLFDTRRGFCEHYAAAYVVLMRAMNVPARIVTGYQGGELNPVDQFMEVRQRDAHAWAEIWNAATGWVRVDPTAAVAPNRIEQGFAQALPPASIAERLITNSNVLRYARFNWDAITNSWNQWVLSFNEERQQSLFGNLGLPNVDWQKLTIALIGGFALVLAAIGLTMLPRRTRLDPVQSLYARFGERLARVGLERAPSEAPRPWLERIGARLPVERRNQARTIVALYEQLRYAPPGAQRDRVFREFQSCVRAFRVQA